MMRRFIVLFLIVQIASSNLMAQKNFSLGLIAIPTLSTINTQGSHDDYQFIFPFNYGVRVISQKGKFIFSSGLLNLTQGTKFKVLKTSASNPQGNGEYYDIIIRTKTIALPVNADYIFKSKNKREFFGGIGLFAGYMYSQREVNTSVPKDYKPDSTIISAYPIQRFWDLEIFDDYYFGINAGLGVRQFLNDKLSFHFRPNFLFQLRKKLPPDKYAWTNRLMSFSLDIGLFYRFGK